MKVINNKTVGGYEALLLLLVVLLFLVPDSSLCSGCSPASLDSVPTGSPSTGSGSVPLSLLSFSLISLLDSSEILFFKISSKSITNG